MSWDTSSSSSSLSSSSNPLPSTSNTSGKILLPTIPSTITESDTSIILYPSPLPIASMEALSTIENNGGYETSSSSSSSFNNNCKDQFPPFTNAIVPHSSQTNPQSNTLTTPHPDRERQILLLMLLSQVCSLHDPTPRTFTVHVLNLFERGLLDFESIRFLFDLNLVPKDFFNKRVGQNSDPLGGKLPDHEVNTSPNSSSRLWNAELHPLSFSRYQREFREMSLLASGSFGSVYHAQNTLDKKDYAVKCVTFSSVGFSNEKVECVLREIRCLARVDHVNCVRYYTAWLEPSWMTGRGDVIGGDTVVVRPRVGEGERRKMLRDVERMVWKEEEESNKSWSWGSDGLEENGNSAVSDDDCSEWSEDDHRSSVQQLDSSNPSSSFQWDDSSPPTSYQHPTTKKQQPPPPTPKEEYKYRICLFIQMELCQPFTLADWIRNRNSCSQQPKPNHPLPSTTLQFQIFSQIAHGLYHVHKQNIIHRDLKPENIFAAKAFNKEQNDITFKIGDFGLSKLLFSNPNVDHPIHSNSNDNKDTSTSSSIIPFSRQESHTMGVGTASYASPEQISSQEYGPASDIYSLGLILLEIFCPFETAHERIQTFEDCRSCRKLPIGLHDDVRIMILRCTDLDSFQRPNMDSVLDWLEVQKKRGSQSHPNDNVFDKREKEEEEVLNLKMELQKQIAKVELQHQILKEKEATIQRLALKVRELGGGDFEE